MVKTEHRIYAFKCPYCGMWGAKEMGKAKNPIYKCKFCNHSRTIWSKAGFNIVYKGAFHFPSIAADMIRQLNMNQKPKI